MEENLKTKMVKCRCKLYFKAKTPFKAIHAHRKNTKLAWTLTLAKLRTLTVLIIVIVQIYLRNDTFFS